MLSFLFIESTDDEQSATERKKNCNYTSEQLQNALDLVKKQEMNCAEAAKFHDIPYTTLYERAVRCGIETKCKYINLILV